jgi:hypothetical protein
MTQERDKPKAKEEEKLSLIIEIGPALFVLLGLIILLSLIAPDCQQQIYTCIPQ